MRKFIYLILALLISFSGLAQDRKGAFFKQISIVSGEPNLFIGGLSATITSAADLATYLSCTEAQIGNFNIIGDDLEAYISVPYTVNDEAFRNIDITYFKDTENCTATGIRAFQRNSGSPTIKKFSAINLETLGGVAFFTSGNYDKLKIVHLPNCTEVVYGGAPSFPYNCRITRLYLPLATTWGTTTANNNIFGYNATYTNLYAEPTMETINGGGVEGDIAFLDSKTGSTVTYVSDFTPPGNITDLSAGTITSSSVVLNFTPPTSTNSLDFYEVWAYDGTTQIYKHFPFVEITASGATITGLSPGTTYTIKLAACDIYMNGSGLNASPSWSNEIEITTL